jgi:monomeric sarcosine oxidase
MRRVDAVVIGAGAMGSATAWQLARAGRSVILAEQFEPGHRRGSSHGGVRIFRHAYPDRHYVSMAAEALPIWRELEDETGEVLLELHGCYDHGPEAELRPIAEALAAEGIDHEWLTPAAASERTPGLRFDGHVITHAAAGRCFADRTVAALQRRVAELGGEVRCGVRAALRQVDDRVEVDLGDETVSAAVAVVTAGAWVSSVLQGTIITPPLLVTQEQVVHFQPTEPTAVWPSFIHHAAPFRYGLHTPGEGLKVGGHHEGAVTSADDRDFLLDPAIVAAIEQYVEHWVPGVDPTPQFGATCLYTTTANEDFLLDRVGPIVIGSPCSGHGFKFTPLIGRMLADLAMAPDDSEVDSIVEPRHRLSAFT